MQPVASVTIVGPRVAFIINRNTVAGPQPAQALCPERNKSGFSAISFVVNFHSLLICVINITPLIPNNEQASQHAPPAAHAANLRKFSAVPVDSNLFLPNRKCNSQREDALSRRRVHGEPRGKPLLHHRRNSCSYPSPPKLSHSPAHFEVLRQAKV